MLGCCSAVAWRLLVRCSIPPLHGDLHFAEMFSLAISEHTLALMASFNFPCRKRLAAGWIAFSLPQALLAVSPACPKLCAPTNIASACLLACLLACLQQALPACLSQSLLACVHVCRRACLPKESLVCLSQALLAASKRWTLLAGPCRKQNCCACLPACRKGLVKHHWVLGLEVTK